MLRSGRGPCDRTHAAYSIGIGSTRTAAQEISMMTTRHVTLLGCLGIWAAQSVMADAPSPMRVAPQMLRAPRTYAAADFKSEGLEAIFYDGLPWKGKPTRVFAWLGIPKLGAGRKAPGVVLVHGGGGTAFDRWVRLWVEHGYAAIAMDTCGAIPKGSYGKWERHQWAGPPGYEFDTVDQPMADHWPFHAVADVILAHSLLRSRPEVATDRIGITGISWGGYLTCIVSGLDDRLKFAVPVYGCGFLGENSAWSDQLAKLGTKGERWLSMWDPSHYLKNGAMPKLWVNGTNDFAYPMDSMQKSYRIAGGRLTLCIRPRMPHGHNGLAETAEEIRAFADSIVQGGKPLTEIVDQTRDGDRVQVRFRGDAPAVRTTLLYTKDTGDWTKRRWEMADARTEQSAKSATAKLPPGTTVYFLNLIDEKGRIVSSEHVSIENSKK
jgi:dienelactone hydrolase